MCLRLRAPFTGLGTSTKRRKLTRNHINKPIHSPRLFFLVRWHPFYVQSFTNRFTRHLIFCRIRIPLLNPACICSGDHYFFSLAVTILACTLLHASLQRLDKWMKMPDQTNFRLALGSASLSAIPNLWSRASGKVNPRSICHRHTPSFCLRSCAATIHWTLSPRLPLLFPMKWVTNG